MTWMPLDDLQAYLLCLLRISACLMVMPGFSSGRVPMRFRISVALAVAVAVAPLVIDTVRAAIRQTSVVDWPALMFGEIAIGLTMGLISRLMFAAFQFASGFIAAQMGLAMPAGLPFEDGDTAAPPTDLLYLTATVAFFALDLHLEMVSLLVQSYTGWAVATDWDTEAFLSRLVASLSSAFSLAIKLTMPLLVALFLVNVSLGLANRLVPNLPTQFLGVPLLLGIGLYIVAAQSPDMIGRFILAFSQQLK